MSGPFYVWHGEGECQNKADTLAEARKIEKELREDGHDDVYITDADDNAVENLK